MLQKVAQHAVNIKLIVNAEDISASIDPLKIVETYKVKGGPAPTEVERALTARKRQVVFMKSHVSKLKQKLDVSKSKLESAASAYAKVSSECK
jgi:hypothetical protein